MKASEHVGALTQNVDKLKFIGLLTTNRYPMRGNLPIPEIPHGEDIWLVVLVTSIRSRRTQQGRLYCDATGRNSTGSIPLKIWDEVLDEQGELKPFGVTGKLKVSRCSQLFFRVSPITIEKYRSSKD